MSWARGRVRRWGIASAAIVAAVISIGLADGQTAALVVAAGVLVGVVARRMPAFLCRGAPAVVVAVIGGFAATAFPAVAPRFLGDAALTGRVWLWRTTFDVLTAEEWIRGVGSRPFERPGDFTDRLGSVWPAIHAHSLPLEMLLTAGLAGLAATLLMQIAMLHVGLRAARSSGGWSAAVAVVLVMYAMTEPSLVAGPRSGRFFVVAGIAFLLNWQRDTEEDRASQSEEPTAPVSGSRGTHGGAERAAEMRRAGA
jgi:O-antigen ligase